MLCTVDAVLDALAAAELALEVELIIERSERIHRVVSTVDGDRTAIDTFVRAVRVGGSTAR